MRGRTNHIIHFVALISVGFMRAMLEVFGVALAFATLVGVMAFYAFAFAIFSDLKVVLLPSPEDVVDYFDLTWTPRSDLEGLA